MQSNRDIYTHYDDDRTCVTIASDREQHGNSRTVQFRFCPLKVDLWTLTLKKLGEKMQIRNEWLSNQQQRKRHWWKLSVIGLEGAPRLHAVTHGLCPRIVFPRLIPSEDQSIVGATTGVSRDINYGHRHAYRRLINVMSCTCSPDIMPLL